MSSVDHMSKVVNRGQLANLPLEPVPPPTMENEGYVIESGGVSINVLWVSPDRRHATGVWEAQPGVIKGEFLFDENSLFLSGRMTMTDWDGNSPMEVEAGESLHFPNGTRAIWTIHEPLRKLFSIYNPDGLPMFA